MVAASDRRYFVFDLHFWYLYDIDMRPCDFESRSCAGQVVLTTHLNHLTSMAEWLSVRLQTKGLWEQILL